MFRAQRLTLLAQNVKILLNAIVSQEIQIIVYKFTMIISFK